MDALTEEIKCIGCGGIFESDNEDDMVEGLCPDCLDGQDCLSVYAVRNEE